VLSAVRTVGYAWVLFRVSAFRVSLFRAIRWARDECVQVFRISAFKAIRGAGDEFGLGFRC